MSTIAALMREPVTVRRMKIALLGGTGDVGEGLALRWAYDTNHQIIIGSREAERAETKAEEYENELDSRAVECSIEGYENAEAATRGDVVVLAVPPYHVADTVEEIAESLDEETILVSPAVGMQRDEAGMHYHRPSAGSVTAVADDAAPAAIPVVGGFYTLSADRLANLDAELDQNTVVLGDDRDAKETVTALADAIEGIRPLDAGPLANAPEAESLAPLLINLAKYNRGLHNAGVRFD